MSFTDKLLQIDSLKQQIDVHGKLPDEVLKKINYKFRLEWNYHSNSMEGNSLTRQETRSVMVGNITVEGKPIQDVLEMKGHDDVISDILKMGKGELNISERRIKDIHKGIVHEEDAGKAKLIGQWKTTPNYLYNYKKERFDFVEPDQLPERMQRLINSVNTQKEKIQRGDKDAMHPVLMAFQFHLDYITIHPFYDGNGRTARIFTNLILIAYGYPPIYIRKEEKNIYYQYLADVQGYGGEPDLFYDFMAGLLVRSLQLVLDAMEGKEIAEPDDWEKRLSLLKQEIKGNDGGQVAKSTNEILKVISYDVLPLIEKATTKLAVFDELFEHRTISFGTENSLARLLDKDHILGMITLMKHNGNIESIAFGYELNRFKKSNLNKHSVYSKLTWRFERFKYVLFINSIDYDKSISKLYGEYYTEAETDAIVNDLAQSLVKRLEEFMGQ